MVQAADSSFAFLDSLNASAKNYLRILDNDFQGAATRRSVRSLLRVGFEEWIPPLLAFLNDPIDDLSEQEFIDLLERITYQNWIRRLAFTARLTVYFQLINAIRARKSAGNLKAVFYQNAQNEEFLSLLDGEVYGKPFAQALLLRLEEAHQDESVTKDYSGRITIEHVLPQALKDPYWRDRFSEDEHRRWLHRLGNLALLAGSKNYKAQYFDFERKKKIYSDRNSKVSFDTTKQILDQSEWKSEAIAARQNEMVTAAKSIWVIE